MYTLTLEIVGHHEFLAVANHHAYPAERLKM